jgi:dTDP-L-rhamnose 4-epimerase
VFEDGRQLRDFVHVTDVARANVQVLLRDEPVRDTLNISSGEPHTIGELAERMSLVMGSDSPPPVVTGRFRIGDVRHVFAPPTRARSVLGYKPTVSFEDGIAGFAKAHLRETATSSEPAWRP